MIFIANWNNSINLSSTFAGTAHQAEQQANSWNWTKKTQKIHLIACEKKGEKKTKISEEGDPREEVENRANSTGRENKLHLIRTAEPFVAC
jgi:hypothetical protein